MEISGLEDVAGRTESQHRDRVHSSRGFKTIEGINDGTALASEMAEIISSWGSEGTVQFAANSKFATKLTETKLQRTFHAGTK